jgi:hypothetical protein
MENILKSCTNCKNSFQIDEKDKNFYNSMEVPEPKFCPDCRLQRRLAWRNEKTLYRRTCALCQKNMIAIFPAQSPYKVYCQDCWWSDKWNSLQYGRDFDFTKPFFAQFADLLKDVPFYGLVNQSRSLENSEYVNYLTDAKNCYLVFAANYLQDCMYSSYIWQSRDVLDSMHSTKLELCYFCLDCDELYNCQYLQNSKGCSDCILGFELRNCKNCFGCINLQNKEYYFFNESLPKDEYQKKVSEILNDRKKFKEMEQEFKSFSLKFPKRYAYQINCENSTGDGIKNCKNAVNCFDGYGGQDIKWMINFPGEVRDCYDISGCAKLERAIDSHALVPGYEIKYSSSCLNGGNNLSYCAYTDGGKNLFGCIGTKKAEYAILNKLYNKDEYEKLTGRIIEFMKQTGEYGEFFPVKISPFAYNETVAQEYFPLTKEEVQKKGYTWKEDGKNQSQKKPTDLPNNIQETKDSITDEILTCAVCMADYKIIPQELKFYRKINSNIPTTCPSCRQKYLLSFRNPRKLWPRNCQKCKNEIQTTYSPDRPETVYCEKCYLEAVY